MEILLVMPRYNLTTKKDYHYFFPLGLPYISAVIKKEGYSVDCLNLNHLEGTVEEIIQKQLDSKKYDILGIGGNALNYAVIDTVIQTSRKHPSNPKIILGGPIITTEPELIFEALNPDIGIIGEGEETIVDILKKIKKKQSTQKIKSIMFRDKSGNLVRTVRRKAIENLNSLPFPDYEGFGFSEQLDHLNPNFSWIHNAFDNPRVYYALCSRSCPFQCTFCYHEDRYRTRSIENVFKEIRERVKKYKINIIFLYDECLGVDKNRISDFCREMNKLRKEVSWDLKWICQIRVDAVNRNILSMIKKAGCEAVSYGFESYSPTVLKSMRKNITPEQIDKALKETLNQNLGIQAFFIFGDIAETKETARETLNYWKNNCEGQVGLGFIQPYPGSQIYKSCVERGIIPDKLSFIKNKIAVGLWLNMTESMSDKEINQLRKNLLDYMAKYPKFVIPFEIKKNYPDNFYIKVKCPYCNQEIAYDNCFMTSKLNFGFIVLCRHCRRRFFVVSLLQKIAYRYYPITRTVRDYYLNIKRFILKKTL